MGLDAGLGASHLKKPKLLQVHRNLEQATV